MLSNQKYEIEKSDQIDKNNLCPTQFWLVQFGEHKVYRGSKVIHFSSFRFLSFLHLIISSPQWRDFAALNILAFYH